MTDTSASSSIGGAGKPMEQVREQTREAVHQGQEMAGKMMDQARTQINSQLCAQKDQLAGTIEGIADAVRSTGQQLNRGEQANLTPYVTRAAEMIEGVGGYLRQNELEDIVADVESAMRRNPGVFIGAAVAIGFLTARFLKSSGDQAGCRTTLPDGRQGASRHPREVRRDEGESVYRTRRMNRRPGAGCDRAARGSAGWSTGASAGAAPSSVPMNDAYEMDETDDVAYSTRTMQE